MAKGKIGTLQKLNGSNIMIDGIWYDGASIVQYIPTTLGITVEYSADDNNVLSFVREKKAFVGKKKDSFSSKPGFKDTSKVQTSICKQLLLKVASNLVSSFTYGSTEEAREDLDKVYQALKKSYLEDIVN